MKQKLNSNHPTTDIKDVLALENQTEVKGFTSVDETGCKASAVPNTSDEIPPGIFYAGSEILPTGGFRGEEIPEGGWRGEEIPTGGWRTPLDSTTDLIIEA